MSAIVKVRLAHACKCIYRLCDIHTIVGNVSETRKCMYSEMYLRYAREGLIVHLYVLIAKRKDLVVCVCLNCWFKVYRRISFVPDIPKEFEFVCLIYHKCFANIDYMFDEMHDKDEKVNNNPATIFMHIDRWLNNICNLCMTHLVISLKHFFMPFIPDEYL